MHLAISWTCVCGLLQKHLKNDLGPWGRTICDRIIRACNQKLGSGVLLLEHYERLVELVELAVHGYELIKDPVVPGSPLYLEKIIFHILQKVITQGAHGPAIRLGEIMYHRLQCSSTEVRKCFVLWRNHSFQSMYVSHLSFSLCLFAVHRCVPKRLERMKYGYLNMLDRNLIVSGSLARRSAFLLHAYVLWVEL